MAHDLSPYLRVPSRDLPTACKQTRQARGLRTRPCGTCDLSDLCRRAMRTEPQAVSALPELVQEAGEAGRLPRAA